MKIGVLGNCQAHGVAQCIRLLAPQVEVVSRSVALTDGDKPEVITALAAEMAACDLALIQTLEEVQPRLTGLFETALAQSRSRARRWPPVIFRGFHPDCVYVMRDGLAMDGIVGPYHSALLCAAWAEGLAPERAAGLFNTFAYAALGYFDAFDEAVALLEPRTRRHGFDLSAFLNVPAAPFMHTVNHPRVEILQSVAVQALDLAGIARSPTVPLPEDELAQGPVWPAYPELAQRGGWAPTPASWSLSDIGAVARQAYEALDKLEDRSLGEGPGEQAIQRARDFIRTHVVR
jgi:hypothetical protein